MEKRDKNRFIIWLLVVIIILLVTILAVVLIKNGQFTEINQNSNNGIGQDINANNGKNDTDTIEIEEQIKLKDKAKSIVYTVEKEYNVTFDDFDVTHKGVMRIPVINIDSSYADECNKEIEKLLNSMKQYESINYSYYEYNQKIFVVVTISNLLATESHDRHYVFNLDILSGEKVTNEEMKSLTAHDNETIYNDTIERIEEKYSNYIDHNDTSANIVKLKEELKRETLRLYIDNAGNLNVIFLTMVDIEKGEIDTIYTLK